MQTRLQQDVGVIPAYFKCNKCGTLMTAPEVFQLESLENQNKTLKHLKGFQSYLGVVALVISFLALVVSCYKLLFF
jgi:hypothetical protein